MSDLPTNHLISGDNSAVETGTELLRETVDLLERLEWEGDRTHFICPACHVDRSRGHESWCQLSRMLNRLNAFLSRGHNGKEVRKEILSLETQSPGESDRPTHEGGASQAPNGSNPDAERS